MYVLTAASQYHRKCDIEFRVLAIFKDKANADREKRHIEKHIAKAWKEFDHEDDTMYEKQHSHWRYIVQLDEQFDPEYEKTEYSIHKARIKTVL